MGCGYAFQHVATRAPGSFLLGAGIDAGGRDILSGHTHTLTHTRDGPRPVLVHMNVSQHVVHDLCMYKSLPNLLTVAVRSLPYFEPSTYREYRTSQEPRPRDLPESLFCAHGFVERSTYNMHACIFLTCTRRYVHMYVLVHR